MLAYVGETFVAGVVYLSFPHLNKSFVCTDAN